MFHARLVVALALSTSLFSAVLANPKAGNNNGNGGGAGNNQDVLSPANVQTGSQSDGQGKASGVAAGQAASATDPANFINFCTGKTLTNGLQVKGGSCNGIPMGDIPATTNMVSSIITNPSPGQDLAANQDFDIKLQVANLNAGIFTNPDVTYYSAPQALENGNIVGHVHVTVQTLGNNLSPAQAPDASKFAFFKGIDDAGDGKGGLTATVAGGLPAGFYRVCTLTSAANHQPVTMPIAQRGAQDDCTKFTVGEGKAGGNAGGNGDENTGNSNVVASGATAATSTATAEAAAGGNADAVTTAAAAAATTAAAGGSAGGSAGGQNNTSGGNQGSNGSHRGQGQGNRFRQHRHRFEGRPQQW